MTAELDPKRCPVCGGPNDCGMAAGKSECWCAEVKISAEALERVPEGAKGKVCLCRECAEIRGATRDESARVRAVGEQ